MNAAKFFISLILGLLLCFFPTWKGMLNAPTPETSLDALKPLAIQLDGRKKPLDTVARETVTQLHGSLTYQPLSGDKLDYLQIYTSLLFNNRDWNEEPFILFSYRPLKTELGLNPEQKYFSFAELVSSTLSSQILEAREAQAQELDLTRSQRESLTLEDRLALILETVGSSSLPIVPHPEDVKGKWLGIGQAQEMYAGEKVEALQQTYLQIKQDILVRNNAGLEAKVRSLQQQLIDLSPNVYPPAAQLNREVRFYGLHLFTQAWILYGLAFVVMLCSLWRKPLEGYWSAIGFFTSGLAVHTYGFWERMQIAGRPPVTNMYESVIWVSLGIAAIALIFELIHRAKYYLISAAPLSVLCLVLADRLPAVLDPSIKPLVPVLRDNFWLSVHVPTITLGYASFALAFGLGHILLGTYLLQPERKELTARLSRWNYNILQVGTLLLTTGIILGGIWAHFSWGRFWGWDPKETWALIALMCYIVPLHGRLAGWLGNFGMAIASVVSFNAILMAWYGVNFVLGTGLHSYGFTTGGSELIVASLIGLDLLFVTIVVLRHQFAIEDSVSSRKAI
ncbi:cytochrome c biogenesis protein [Roseofilum casamattae]|uniref:Heme exporter protein C n=1 Tax=Roseofilum casamattae BLCC-M143 TaxID=3022442 RepID=A0ABT7BVS6_9CYAN|nr:cytochrome c biogenesis protein CcsA [Roseofilum casamattae]MDJ1182614.1 cytochrome c biogenesis protein CcsA [Roseofilum casamattae BLCC-M143]